MKLDIDFSIRNDTNHWPVGVPLPRADAKVTLTCILVYNGNYIFVNGTVVSSYTKYTLQLMILDDVCVGSIFSQI